MSPTSNILWQPRDARFFDVCSITYYTHPLADGLALGAEIDGRLALLGWLETGQADEAESHIKQRWPKANVAAGVPSFNGWHIPLEQPGQPHAWPVLPLIAVGTDFQISVWQALLAIPCGETATYGTIASNLGRPAAARAVGTAIGANPLAVLIPCHRVLPANGNTGGYYWGSQRKQSLLESEASATKEAQTIAA